MIWLDAFGGLGGWMHPESNHDSNADVLVPLPAGKWRLQREVSTGLGVRMLRGDAKDRW